MTIITALEQDANCTSTTPQKYLEVPSADAEPATKKTDALSWRSGSDQHQSAWSRSSSRSPVRSAKGKRSESPQLWKTQLTSAPTPLPTTPVPAGAWRTRVTSAEGKAETLPSRGRSRSLAPPSSHGNHACSLTTSACSSLAPSPVPSPRSRARRYSAPGPARTDIPLTGSHFSPSSPDLCAVRRPLTFKLRESPEEHALRHPLGGKLRQKAVNFFAQAYGLKGQPRRRHDLIISQAIEETGCSERAIQETLYGHSYSPLLQEYRDLIPGYPPKLPNRLRLKMLRDILTDLPYHAFYRYDGNAVKTAA